MSDKAVKTSKTDKKKKRKRDKVSSTSVTTTVSSTTVHNVVHSHGRNRGGGGSSSNNSNRGHRSDGNSRQSAASVAVMDGNDDDDDAPETTSTTKQRSKNRSRGKRDMPQELSSKVPVSRFQNVMNVASHSKRQRDPRFDEDCGEFSQHKFGEAYKFIDEYKEEEMSEMQRQLGKVKNQTKKEKLRDMVKQYREEQVASTKSERQRGIQSKFRKAERQQVAAGKQPFYLKKSQQKDLSLLDQYLTLQNSGGLDKFMAKRRKKNSAKDHRWMPAAKPE